jgi:hypothetical protein
MPRLQHFLRGLGSSYLLLLANTISTLVSLPLALSFLERGEFTVWLVVIQTGTYLSLIDLGTSGSGIRLLIDYKDNPGKGEYGSLIQSMCLVQIAQAVVIFFGGLACANVLPGLLKNIPPGLVDEFRVLWIWQVTFLAFSFAFRTGNQVLHAHQRIDISNYANIGSAVLNVLVLLLCLRAGLRLYSFVIAQGVSVLFALATTNAACFWLKLWPPAEALGRVTRRHLNQLFALAGEFFLIILGATIIIGSQGLLLTRLHSLDSALIWSIMTKPFTLCQQIVTRLVGGAATAFAEMSVRGELDRLWKRYRAVFELSVLAAGYFAVLIAFGNDALVTVWTKKPIFWDPVNNWLLFAWLILLIQSACHTSLLLHCKQAKLLKLVYFGEAAVFLSSAVVVVPRWGITGMLICSVLCTALFSAMFGAREVSKLFRHPFSRVALGWTLPLGRFLGIMVPLGFVLSWFTRDSAWLRLFGCALPLALVGPLVALRFCLPGELRQEVISRSPSGARTLLRVVLGMRASPS